MSKYLESILECAKNEDSNIFIKASAGAGKTYCLCKISELIPKSKKSIFLAFNKSIAEELRTRLPHYIEVATIHSKAYSILRSNLTINVKVNDLKNFIYCKYNIKRQFKEVKKQNAHFFTVSSAISFLKSNNLTPTNENIKAICDSYGLDLNKDHIEDTKIVFNKIKLEEQNLNKRKPLNIDFTDMLYLCANKVNVNSYPKYDYVMLDECFPGDQKISMGDHKKKIKKIFESHLKGEVQYVKSYNEEKNIFELKKVTNAWNKGVREVMKLMVGGKRKIVLTPNHKLLTDRGWVESEKIEVGDFILSSSKNQPYHSFPNEDQKDLLIASSIGDGHVSNLSLNVNRVSFIHGEPQKEYLEWKANLLNCEDIVRKVEENGFSKKPAYTFNCKGYCIKDSLFEKENVINNLNLKQLAVIYMDDGSFLSNTSRLYTFAYSQSLIKKLSEKLLNMGFQNKVFESKSSSSNTPYWYISFTVESSKLLCESVSPYIHSCFKYKISEEFHHLIETYKWSNTDSVCGGMTVTDKILNFGKETVYDIEVEDNHNFIICGNSNISKLTQEVRTNGFIAHNCQDLSDLQQVIVLNLLKPDSRLIAVGDDKQSINQFNGSSLRTFEAFQNRPNTKIFSLPLTYRCAKKIVDAANTIFPDQTFALDDAVDGFVGEGDFRNAQAGDMIICRNNKPLIGVWLELVKLGKKSSIMGRDFGTNLKSVLGKINKIEDLEPLLKEKIVDLKEMGIENPYNSNSYQSLKEKTEIIELLYFTFGSVNEVEKRIDEIFSNDIKGITLSTIHKSKGLEADRVYVLNYDLIPSKFAFTDEQLYSEKCLQYVAITRPRKELIFTNIEL